ncbi:MAG: GntR family transcriptional regulator [Planctomycetota bacterium]|nr:MAG: GntR family transcriptional regulator [Planctomycetota bacterium]
MDRSLAEKSYRHIVRKLSRGEFPPGTQLVNRTLASEIGVSVIPVREAIQRLASEGVVEHVPGAGAFVREPSWRDLDELYVLRDALESCAAEEAALHITAEQLDELERGLQEMQHIHAAIEERRSKVATPALLNRWLDCEEDFHSILVDAARNRLLSKVIRDHRAITRVFDAHRRDPSLLTAQVAETTCRDRRRLLAALRARDAALCRRLMSEHIKVGRKTVLNHLHRRREIGRASGDRA